jgi:hypothetical protein
MYEVFHRVRDAPLLTKVSPKAVGKRPPCRSGRMVDQLHAVSPLAPIKIVCRFVQVPNDLALDGIVVAIGEKRLLRKRSCRPNLRNSPGLLGFRRNFQGRPDDAFTRPNWINLQNFNFCKKPPKVPETCNRRLSGSPGGCPRLQSDAPRQRGWCARIAATEPPARRGDIDVSAADRPRPVER